jgi:hypothetical protein
MTEDRTTAEWWEWHLTPAGWIWGSQGIGRDTIDHKPIPADAALTLRQHVAVRRRTLGGGGAELERWSTEQRHKDHATINELRSKWGRPPDADNYPLL